MPNYGDYQLEIYLAGLAGIRPPLPFSYPELARRAASALPTEILSYVAGGAGNEFTQDLNVAAFDRYGLTPRMLAGAAERDLTISLFGLELPTPLLLAPVGVVGLCSQDGTATSPPRARRRVRAFR